jgi:hypothetical protein
LILLYLVASHIFFYLFFLNPTFQMQIYPLLPMGKVRLLPDYRVEAVVVYKKQAMGAYQILVLLQE